MRAPTRRTNCIFRLLVGIFGSLLAVCVCFSAPRQPQDAIPVSAISELKSHADFGDPAARNQLKEFLVSADPASPGYDQAVDRKSTRLNSSH